MSAFDEFLDRNAVIHHTQCGMGFLADDDFRHKFATRTGLDELGLLALAVTDPAATVCADVEQLLAGFAVAAAAFFALVIVENRQDHPMLDVRLFANLRFTAASGAVTLAFFALSGFVFLIILYFQIMRGYSPLGTGVRVLPVAGAIAISSGLGTVLAVRAGNKIIVAAGLILVGAGYGWIAVFQTSTTSYGLIVFQMLLLGTGMGLSTAPATEAVLGVVRPEEAGVGSAGNDATRLVGGTLGVAILGSVYASLYRTKVDTAAAPQAARDAANASYGASRTAAAHLPPGAAHSLLAHANSGFLDGLHAGCAVAAGVCALGAIIVAAYLPANPGPSPEPSLGRRA